MKEVTIITATYNREKELKNLYKSLKKQSSYEFEWLVINDGSVDGTDAYMKSIINEPLFKINYMYKENGGKHKAINMGLNEINTPLVMIVDSDDTLLPNAIEEILKIHDKYKYNNTISTYTFLRITPNGEIIRPVERDEFVDNYIKYRIKGNRPGDMAEVFRTDIFKSIRFPEFKNERFLSEDVCWIEMAKKYDSVYINKPIYVCEYLKGGLTDSDKKVKFMSPKGSMLRGIQLMYKKCGIKNNLKGAIIYNVYARELRNDKVCLETYYEKALVALTKPLSGLFYKKWRQQCV